MSAPLDTRVDRRSFLVRMGILSSAAAASVALPSVAYASPGSVSGSPGGLGGVDVRPEALADLTELTIAEAATLIRAGRLSSERLVEAYLDRIGAFDPTYQAFNLVLADEALAAARAVSKRSRRSPLSGIPLAIKDNYYTAGVPTTANSYLFQDFTPHFDATAVQKLTSSGAVILGKTQMGPLATTRATTPDGIVTTVNAWTPSDPSTNPGGSSSGSATAVAARMATSSVGTQTGGSITAPANAQNLTGLKPTMGRVSLHGIIPLSYTRDHPGPIARDVKDAAIMLSAMAGEDPRDPRTQGLPPVPDVIQAATPVKRGRRTVARWRTRVGIIPGYTSGDSATAAARRTFLETLAGVDGIDVVDVSLPDDWEIHTSTAFNNVRLPERTEPFLPMLRKDLRGFGVSVTGWLQGALLGGTEYLAGQRAKVLMLERVLEDLFGQCDVVVQTSPNPFDAIGLPELALPIGFTEGGLPIGTILGGQPFGEDRLLSVGAAYQSLTDWHLRRPVDPAGDRPEPLGIEPRGREKSAQRPRGRVPAAVAQRARGRFSADDVARLMQ